MEFGDGGALRFEFKAACALPWVDTLKQLTNLRFAVILASCYVSSTSVTGPPRSAEIGSGVGIMSFIACKSEGTFSVGRCLTLHASILDLRGINGPVRVFLQVTGTFSVDKSVFAPDEPVFLNLTLSNQGTEPEEVVTSDPYPFCSEYQIQISRQGSPHVACSQNWGGSCMGGAIILAPRGSHTERILLNYPNKSRGDLNPPVSLPGDYTVDALRSIGYVPFSPHSQLFESPSHSEVHQVLDIHVDGTLEVSPSVYAPFV